MDGEIDEMTTNPLVLSFLSSILGPKKAYVGLGLKKSKYGQLVQEAAGSFSKQSGATMEDFNQISKNALLASIPEISLLTLSSGSGRLGTALLGLNLVQPLKDSIRKRDEGIIGSSKLGISVNKEAADAARRGQDQSDIGSRSNPLYGGRRFNERIAKVQSAFKENLAVVKTDHRLSRIIERMIEDPGNFFSTIKEGPYTFNSWVMVAVLSLVVFVCCGDLAALICSAFFFT